MGTFSGQTMTQQSNPYFTDETARFVLALLMWALVTEIVTVLMFREIPAANREILVGLAGTIVGALVASNNFYNKTGVTNDRQKDDTINKAMTAVATAQAVANPDVNAIPVGDGESKTIVGTGNVDSSDSSGKVS
jgi:hypothetical protein